MSTLFDRLQHTVTPAMATPIDNSGYRVVIDEIAPLVDFLIERNAGALFVGGTTGEGVLLSVAERKRLHTATVEATQGRKPVLVHVGTNTTRQTFELAVHAAEIGADATVCVTPYFYPVDDDSLVRYFKTVAAAAPDLPFLIYDIPHFANNTISPTLLTRLAAEIPNLAGVKCSSGDGQAVRRLIDATPDGVLFLAGNERIMLGSLAMGAHGAISGLSTAVPEPFVGMVDAFANGHLQEAQNWFRLINRLLTVLSHYPRIGGIKQLLNERGIRVGAPMPPRGQVDERLWAQLLDVLSAQGA